MFPLEGLLGLGLIYTSLLFARRAPFCVQYSGEGSMFSGIVAIICPVGLSQGQRKIMSKGMVSNGATVLDFSPGDGAGLSPKSVRPDALQLLMSSARSSTKGGGSVAGSGGKRKRDAGVGSSSAVAQKVSAHAAGPALTHIVCDAGAFAAGRVSQHMEGVFAKHPLKKEDESSSSSVQVVGSAWLSECLRKDSLQPVGPNLLHTVTNENVGKHLGAVRKGTANGKKNGEISPAGSPAKKRPSTTTKTGSLSTTKNPWSDFGPAATPRVSNEAGASSQKLGVGPGSGSRDGPGKLSVEPVWRDDASDGGVAGGEGKGAAGGGGAGRWEEVVGGTVLRWLPSTCRVSTHIVAFDMDGTLIKPKSGKKFGDGVGDWQLLHDSIRATLRAWHGRGYKVAVISNQGGVASGKVDKRMLQAKVKAVVAALGVPVEAYLAIRDDFYRKPRPGCWELLSKTNNGGLDAVPEACLYVGDAAGRPKQGTFKKDFSAADLKLALNAGIPFQTPEQFFLRSTQRIHVDRSLAVLGFDPLSLRTSLPKNASGDVETLSAGGGLELVVLVGPPASGKSTLCRDKLAGHVRVNQDELSSLARCQRVAVAKLKERKNVVIDATNRAKKVRAGWVSLAREHGARARCISISTPKEACFHLNAFRGVNSWSPENERRTVPDVSIHSWFKQMEPVDTEEGFSDVLRIPFVMRAFEGERHAEQDLLLMHLLPK